MARAYPDPEYHAKVQSQWGEDVAEAVKNGTSTTLRVYKVTCEDGSQRDVELVMHPIGDLWVASFNNVTEPKRAEAALRESEENYRNLVELSPDAIIVHREGKVVFANSATLRLIHAREVDEILGLPVISFVHPDLRAIVAARIKEMLEAGEKVSPLEEKFVCLDG